jgi:F-type H+-transporting ATPase subunit gamma
MSTQQITKAMKMVAAAKLRRSQEAVMQLRPYAQKLNSIMANVSSDASIDLSENPYSEVREEEKVLLIMVTSDRGLCGGFNSNIIKAVNILLAGKYKDQAEKGNVTLLTLGKKGNDFYAKRKVNVIPSYSTIFSSLNFEEARKVAERAMKGFVAKEYDKVEVIYNEFKNVATQIVQVKQFLPIAPPETSVVSASTNNVDYIFEPDKESIIKDLIPKSLKISLYGALLESNAAENGARMTAMDKATENAGELLKDLRLSYNRTRQAAITKEILEIVGGAEALASN